jgi:hypothetical protein
MWSRGVRCGAGWPPRCWTLAISMLDYQRDPAFVPKAVRALDLSAVDRIVRHEPASAPWAGRTINRL